MPILNLRNQVLFPGALLRIRIGRPRSVRLLNAVVKEKVRGKSQSKGSIFGVVSQKSQTMEDPASLEDMHPMGTTARVVEVATATQKETEGEDENGEKTKAAQPQHFIVVIEGLAKFDLKKITGKEPYLKAVVAPVPPAPAKPENDVELIALEQNLKTATNEALKLLKLPKTQSLVGSMVDPVRLADVVCANLDANVVEKQEVLMETDAKSKIKMVLQLLNREIEVLKLSRKIDSEVKGDLSKQQREFYLRKQLKAIKDQLGEGGNADPENALEELEQQLKDANLSEEASKLAQRELKRLRGMNSSNAQYSVSLAYLECLAELPWDKSTEDHIDLAEVQKQLDEDHYGLEKIKKRIVEFLAVRKLKDDGRVPILCFMGPPGVGKTSLGSSIAKAMGRKFHRVSLGGVRDDAEIRGHRRTYIGAMPGRILQGLRKVGVNNPVFLLDEIDKMGDGRQGDPASALLETLDPEQNTTFSDHYVEAPFDMSKALFICTGNDMSGIPGPLRDRMEIIELSGYSVEEKLAIAQNYIIPKQVGEHGLLSEEIEIPEDTVQHMIMSYTREAGVRDLERKMAGVCRSVAVKVAQDLESGHERGNFFKTISPVDLAEILGPEIFESEDEQHNMVPGVATGLAWSPAGGDVLYVEASKMPGKGGLQLTGALGDVIKESASMALSYIRGHASELNIDSDFHQKHDIHLHFPAGAVPKDGPSAGVAITTALVSLLRNERVLKKTAMTGEVTLRGLVLPVGGIKEKVLAAHRRGLRRIVLPHRNKKDLVDIPDKIRAELDIILVSNTKEALTATLGIDFGDTPVLHAAL